MNLADIILIIIIAAAAAAAVWRLVKNRGKSCGCGCENCVSKSSCKEPGQGK
ncbi:MAG: FeoB-associated Cys-rich membrane protein [Lachnospiraceae bacterium]|nr:FeoB-associated Cys-rich membrane protein [Lachnospiraceae bacterium]MBR3735883.1 FeoB-associated Cys-rich membrane protein [Lachnospiraceae bacterium]